MFYGSMCSGIEAATVAWHPLGWKAAWFAEIEPYCCSLLREKYDAPNLGDITSETFKQNASAVEVIVGGTPCQSFSINGWRKGMDDPRGQLSLAFVETVGRLLPNWFVWENVAHSLQVDRGRAFGSIVGALAKCGYGWAYRVIDLQGFGIPQRRRRVFLVGHRGNPAAAFAALFDGLSEATSSRATEEARMPAVAGIDGWTGDETPKRGIGVCPTLRSGQGGEGVGVFDAFGIRRLATVEWERLQGFPDGYTACVHNGRPATDKQRQRALGNSFPVPILRWIGERIDFIQKEFSSAHSN